MKSEIKISIFLHKVKKLALNQGEKAGMVEKVSRNDPFKVLVSCLLSLRTKDEMSEKKSKELFAIASTPVEIISQGEEKIAKLIYPVGFYRRKAHQLIEISKILTEKFGGSVPETMEELLSLPGVGRKTANLVISVGFGKPAICVDTHVHRITNRWGYVHTSSPEKTELELRSKLPLRYWNEINWLLVFFGKNICLPVSPKCSVCPLKKMCPAIGVKRKR